MYLTIFIISACLFLIVAVFYFYEDVEQKKLINDINQHLYNMQSEIKILKAMKIRTKDNPLPITVVKQTKKPLLEKAGLL